MLNQFEGLSMQFCHRNPAFYTNFVIISKQKRDKSRFLEEKLEYIQNFFEEFLDRVLSHFPRFLYLLAYHNPNPNPNSNSTLTLFSTATPSPTTEPHPPTITLHLPHTSINHIFFTQKLYSHSPRSKPLYFGIQVQLSLPLGHSSNQSKLLHIFYSYHFFSRNKIKGLLVSYLIHGLSYFYCFQLKCNVLQRFHFLFKIIKLLQHSIFFFFF